MYAIPIVVQIKSLLRIGATSVYFDFASADLPMAKIKVNINGEEIYIPYIPASSFKGVLRSTIESHYRRSSSKPPDFEERFKGFLNELNKNRNSIGEFLQRFHDEIEQLYSVRLVSQNHVNLVKKELESEKPDLNNIKSVIEKYFDVTGWGVKESCYSTSDLDKCENTNLLTTSERKIMREAWNVLTNRDGFCEVCKVYGASGLRSKVRFTSMFPIDPFPIIVDRLTHVSIDRITWAASSQKLYQEEVVYPGVKFLGFMVILEKDYAQKVKDHLNILKGKAEKLEVNLGARGSLGYGIFELCYPENENTSRVIPLTDMSILGKGELKMKEGEANSPSNDQMVTGRLNYFYPSYLLSLLTFSSKR